MLGGSQSDGSSRFTRHDRPDVDQSDRLRVASTKDPVQGLWSDESNSDETGSQGSTPVCHCDNALYLSHLSQCCQS